MKKWIKSLGVIAFAGLSLVSCSKDDDGGPFTFNESDLYGRWDFSKESFTVNGAGTPEVDYTGNEVGCNKDFISFATAGNGVEGDYDGNDCTLFDDAFTWTKTGNDILVNFGGGDTTTFTVLSVNATNLVIQTTETEGSGTFVSTYKLIK
ncbi:MAG: hypothetical protein EOO01_29225 [Chitinophagaceae bacterium]|nr:MAG: hypothetical protein EOO01_29225 [Chitinophagaceae bacterium]